MESPLPLAFPCLLQWDKPSALSSFIFSCEGSKRLPKHPKPWVPWSPHLDFKSLLRCFQKYRGTSLYWKCWIHARLLSLQQIPIDPIWSNSWRLALRVHEKNECKPIMPPDTRCRDDLTILHCRATSLEKKCRPSPESSTRKGGKANVQENKQKPTTFALDNFFLVCAASCFQPFPSLNLSQLSLKGYYGTAPATARHLKHFGRSIVFILGLATKCSNRDSEKMGCKLLQAATS